EIDDEAFLVAVDAEEIVALAVEKGREAVGLVAAARRLDLQHLGPEVAEILRRERAGQHARQVDDPHALQRTGPALPARSRRHYFAAVTMISTSTSGRARSARTQARQGGLAGSTQSFHTAFICENRAMSLIHRLAVKRFDLLVPASFR